MKGYGRIELAVDLAGLQLKNPVIAASGTFGYGIEFANLVDLNRLGGLVVKGLSREPISGNPSPRIFETPAGMLNSIGLQNLGVRAFIEEKLPLLRKYDTVVIANVFGHTMEDYLHVVGALSEAEGVDAIELNVSCPNTGRGGLEFGSDLESLSKVVEGAKRISRQPIIVKLSPNVGDITLYARACQEAGADAISLVNTFVAMAIDVETRRPRLGTIFGGLSGPAIKPIALRMVYQAARAVKIPVIGIGGIVSAEDALEFLIAGAQAVQVGTANFFDVQATTKIIEGLESYCRRKGISDINQIIGSLEVA